MGFIESKHGHEWGQYLSDVNKNPQLSNGVIFIKNHQMLPPVMAKKSKVYHMLALPNAGIFYQSKTKLYVEHAVQRTNAYNTNEFRMIYNNGG